MTARKHFSASLILTFYLLMPHITNAQSLQGDALIDSLKSELAKPRSDTDKIKTLYSLSGTHASSDNKTAMYYANECMNVSNQAKWLKGTGMSYLAFSRAYYETSSYDTALQNCTKAYEIFKKLGDKEYLTIATRYKAHNYLRTGYYTKAIENYLAALRLAEETNNKSAITKSYLGIGNSYYHLEEYPNAIENYKKAFFVSKELNNKYDMASAIDNVASVFLDEGKLDSANIYNEQAVKIFEEINDPPALARIYFNRGNLMMQLNDVKSALDFYERSLNINKPLDKKREIGNNYGMIGELYLTVANDSAKKSILPDKFKTSRQLLLKQSQSYFAKALALSKETGDIDLLMYFTKLASQTEEELGNYGAALAFHKEYTTYRDSIFNDENKNKLAALEKQRLAEVKDKEIQLQTSEVKRQTLLKNIILVSVCAAAVLLFIFIRLYNRRRKIKFNTQVKEVEMKALRSQMNPHFIFNSLHSINKYVMENDRENASAYLSKFSNLMRLILENSREQEVPLEKDLDALELYMQLEALRFKNKFSYSIFIEPGIDKENVLIPPMFLQPFAENAIIHGLQNKENGLIKIAVTKQASMIKCTVEDNGIGRQNVISIEQEGAQKHKSLGTKIISERLNIINQLKKVNAAIHIFDVKDSDNKPGGLRIELLLPFEQAF